jgi:ABC-type amino acid transport substrate-binding protein/DNA-binding response OmpR family regulator/nitrogen-specific signal transduction histidine kinase
LPDHKEFTLSIKYNLFAVIPSMRLRWRCAWVNEGGKHAEELCDLPLYLRCQHEFIQGIAMRKGNRATHYLALIILLYLLFCVCAQAAENVLQKSFLFSDTEQAWLETHPKIQIGIMNAWPPMNYVDDRGEPKGIGVEFIKALNKRLGNRLEVVPGSWKENYEAVKARRLDALMDITPRPSREAFFNFTRPYIDVPHTFFVRSDHPYVESMADLSGKMVGVEHGFYIVDVLKEKYSTIGIKEYSNTSDALDALTKGEVDAFIGNRAVAMLIIKNELITNVKAAGKVRETSSSNAIGVRKDWPILRNILQKTLNDISPEERSRIVSLPNFEVFSEKPKRKKVLLTSEQQAWLDKHKPFRIGVMDGWPPFNFVDEQGVSRGISIEYLAALNKRLGDVLLPVPGEWKRLYDDVVEKRLDLIMDITPKPAREPFFNFTTPYLKVPHVIVAPKSTLYLESEKSLQNKVLAVELGFGNVKYFQQHYPSVKLKLFANTAAALDAVSRGDADAYAGNRVVALYLMEQHFITNLRIHGSLSKPASALAIGVRKDLPILRDIIQRALNDIDVKEQRSFTSHWVGHGRSKRDSQRELNLTNEELEWLRDHQEILIGVDGNWPPIDFMDSSGVHNGITADYLHILGERLGVRFIPQQSAKFKDMLDKVVSGDLKVGASISFNKERAEKLYFSKPFYHVHKVIIARNDKKDISAIEDLYGRRVAVEDGFLTMRQLQEKHPQIKLIPRSSTLEALQMVSWGDADAYVGNQAVAGWLQRLHQLNNLSIVGSPELGSGPQNFAVSKAAPDWQPLIGILDKALLSISNAERHAIDRRWLGASKDIKPLPAVQLTVNERRWLQEHKSIRLGVDADWAPLEFIDSEGEYKGLSSEYMQLFSKQLGINWIKPKMIPWTEVLKQVKNKNLDVLPLVSRTPERDAYLSYTNAYLDFPTVIFNRDGSPLLSGLDDLRGKTVAAIEEYSVTDYLRQDYPEIKLIFYSSVVKALYGVSVGEADAFVGSLAVAGYHIGQEGITNLQVVAPTKYHYKFSIGVRKDWPELVTILNKAIDTLDEQLKNEMFRRWYTVKYKQHVDYTLVWQIVTIAFVVFVVGAIWNMQIRHSGKVIKEGRERLELILKSAQLGAWEARIVADGSLQLSLDETFYRHHGIPEQRQDLSLDDVVSYIDDPHRLQLRFKVAKFLSSYGTDITFEYSVSNQKRWLFSKGHTLERDGLGRPRYIVGITQDITTRHKAHEALAQTNRYKSEFLANMSHEIRTPMNAIIGLGHLLSKTMLQAKQKDYVKKIQVSAQSLLGVIDDILDFSKIEAGRLSIESIPFSFVDIFESLSISATTRIGDNPIEFLYDFDTNIPPKLEGDPYRIGQILTNIVSNAIKFTEKGSVIVRVMVKEKDERQVRLKFEVEDTGIGISSEQLESLFDPFTQADGSTTRKYGGTGLGLSICQQLCTLMGGKIAAESKPGKGSLFYFELPLNYVQSPTLFMPSSNLHGLRVLLVDDNAMAVSVLSDMLESMTFQVTSARSGKDALIWLEEHEMECNLVLIDWLMPGMDGCDTAKLICEKYGEQRPIIIMMTAYGRDMLDQHICDDYLDGLLVKPLTPSQLFDAIIRAYDSKELERPASNLPLVEQTTELLQGSILLVEDNEINQQVAKELLEQMGLDVDTVDDGKKAIEYVGQQHPDLILMDIQMPVMDGYETTRNLRKMPNMASLPIFAMTANALVGDADKSIAAGMNGHISKPVNPEELYNILSEYLPKQLNTAPRKKSKDNDSWALPEQSPTCIDLQRGLKQIGGNPSFYQKLLRDFLSGHGNCVSELKEMIEGSRMEDARRAAHTLKGVGGNIAAIELQQAASELEASLDGGKLPSEEEFNRFSRVCESLFSYLNQIIPSSVNQESDDQSLTGVLPIDKTKLQNLIEMLSSGAATSIGLFQELKPALAQKMGGQQIALLDELIESYEFDQAEELLCTVLKEEVHNHA